MKRQTLTVDQYLELQESYTFKDLQFDSVNCYFNPNYYNNPMYFSPLTYEVINNEQYDRVSMERAILQRVSNRL